MTLASSAAAAERPRARLGQKVKRVHRILSLSVAALWLVQALTGILIVFHWEVNDALVPGATRPVDIAAVSERIETLPLERGPGWKFVSLWTTGGAPDRFKITIANETTGGEQTVRIAGDGSILQRRTPDQLWTNGGWVGQLVLIHHNLLAGDVGSWIVGFSGLLLLSNLLLGLKLAWPRAGTWSRALRPGAMKKGPARTYAWHRAIGLWLIVPALVTISCGTLLVFNQGIREMLNVVDPPFSAPASDLPLRLPTEQAVRTALARFEGAALVAIYPPSEEQPYYDILLRQPKELRRSYGDTSVFVDARSGDVIRIHDPLKAELGRAFVDSLFPIHAGEAAGLFGRLLVMLIGLALVTMIVLGVRLWWVRRR